MTPISIAFAIYYEENFKRNQLPYDSTYAQLRRPICIVRISTNFHGCFLWLRPYREQFTFFGSQPIGFWCTQQLKSPCRVQPSLYWGKGSSATFPAFTFILQS